MIRASSMICLRFSGMVSYMDELTGAARAAFRMLRHEQLLVGFEDDPYKPRRKLRGAARCVDGAPSATGHTALSEAPMRSD